jgi:hypothetical protein
MKLSEQLIAQAAKLPPLVEGDKVKGTMVNIYAATGNEDDTEGHGPQIDKSYHTTLKAALIACRGIGVMGTDGKVVERVALSLDDGRYFLFQNEQGYPIPISVGEEEAQAAADLRTRALEKLSQAERAALGL